MRAGGGSVERTSHCVFFNDTATTEIYTLSLHDALPIWCRNTVQRPVSACDFAVGGPDGAGDPAVDRKSTRLNSSHANISYVVFCLKKNMILYNLFLLFPSYLAPHFSPFVFLDSNHVLCL